MEKEKKEISRKALIGIIVALIIIIVVIAFGVIIFFVSSNNKEIGKDTSSETTLDDNEIINKIYTVLDNVNNEYELGFNPNTEQMNEIIDFYKSTSNFNEESLFNFIAEKGWTIKGTGEIEDKTVAKEQVMNFLTSTDTKTQTPYICQFGELRLRNELEYLIGNISYLYHYNYKVIGDDTINFYILISEPRSNYGIDFYNIWAYQASYTITDETCKYLNDFTSENNANNVMTVKELFKINKEIKLSLYYDVIESNYSYFISEGMTKAASILNFDPYNSSSNNQTSTNNSSTGTNNSSSSNKNTSSNSSSNGNTSKEENLQPVLNVMVDPYSYLSKEEQNRIYENNETKKFNIVIKFNGKTIKSDTITYTGDNYVAPTYENLKVDSESGTLTVEVNGETLKYTDGSTSVAVSMYFLYGEWNANTFDFYDITKMMG